MAVVAVTMMNRPLPSSAGEIKNKYDKGGAMVHRLFLLAEPEPFIWQDVPIPQLQGVGT